jgi:hypothetical protein
VDDKNGGTAKDWMLKKNTLSMDNQPNQCVAMNIHIVRSKTTGLPNRPMWHYDDIEADTLLLKRELI